MANYAILRVEKRKLTSVNGIYKHHERKKQEYKSNPDIDPNRANENYHLIEPKDSYRNAALARIAEVGAKRRRDSVVLQDCFIGATPEWIRAKSLEEQKGFFQRALEFFIEKIGKANIISAVVHMDEATPHMHLCFVPITKNGRLSSKTIIGGPAGLRKWQDEFYTHMSEKYPDLSRGIPASLTHRKHLPVYMFKCAADLYEHHEEICQAIKDIGLFNNSKKKEEAIALIEKYAPEMVSLKAHCKSTEQYIRQLEQSVDNWAQDSRAGWKEAKDQKEQLMKANEKIYELHRRQKYLEGVISRIPPEVLEEMKRREYANRRKCRDDMER